MKNIHAVHQQLKAFYDEAIGLQCEAVAAKLKTVDAKVVEAMLGMPNGACNMLGSQCQIPPS